MGLPYNFKKLLRRSDFSGHVNYSAPELILEKTSFSEKIDIWALGCCIYFIFNKCDPFEGKDPQVIKQKILNFNMNQTGSPEEALDAKKTSIRQLIQACLNFQDMIRPSCAQILQTIEKARMSDSNHPKAKSYHSSHVSELSYLPLKNNQGGDTVSHSESMPVSMALNEDHHNRRNSETPRLNSIRKVFSSSIGFYPVGPKDVCKGNTSHDEELVANSTPKNSSSIFA